MPDYAIVHYFIDSKTIQDNLNKFLFKPLIALLIEKLIYQNIDNKMKKLS